MLPRHAFLVIAATTFAVLCMSSAAIAAEDTSVIEVPAAPERGYHHGYVLFVPKLVDGGPPQYLLVEPNNTGRPDDDIAAHHAAAVALARDSSVGNFVATRLGIPLLVPVFPRPSSIEDTYTHSLDRDTILIHEGPLARLDQQLIAMAEDARGRLAALGRPVNTKLLLNGFSASGLFANRFTFLHPHLVAAAAFGGLNGFIMVPAAEVAGHRLRFPLGLADFEEIAGHPFDRVAYSHVPQFAYMGEKDTNDAVLHDDAYPADQRAVIFDAFGRTMMPDRWNAVQEVYRQQKLPIEFKTYPGIPHGTNRAINSEVADFFRRVIEQPPKT